MCVCVCVFIFYVGHYYHNRRHDDSMESLDALPLSLSIPNGDHSRQVSLHPVSVQS